MRKASFIGGFVNNELFDLSNKQLNRDNFLFFAFELKQRFQELGVSLATPDIHDIETSDFVLYANMPKVLPREEHIHKSFLILFESEVIQPDNFIKEKHACFNKIFTWHDDLVDNIKYFKINFSHKFPTEIDKTKENSKLCALIAGNKKVNHPLELYSKRVEAIRWFERHHPDEFSLYGVGWDKPVFRGVHRLYRLGMGPLLEKLAPKYPSYKGKVKSKLDVLSGYKFSICYENARDIPGYITEKIFDCFFAGCVPVYWGANNIEDYIPSDCFIDKRKFGSYEELYAVLKNMPEETYHNYLDRIEEFLLSNNAYPFTCQYFAETVTREVLQ